MHESFFPVEQNANIYYSTHTRHPVRSILRIFLKTTKSVRGERTVLRRRKF